MRKSLEFGAYVYVGKFNVRIRDLHFGGGVSRVIDLLVCKLSLRALEQRLNLSNHLDKAIVMCKETQYSTSVQACE